MTTSLSSRGYGLLKARFTEGELNELRNELTVSPLNNMILGNDEKGTMYLYLESPKKLYLPKCFGLAKYGVPNEVKLEDGDDIYVEFHGDLRAEQRDPVDNYLAAARDPKLMGGIINLSCGAGKTVLGLYIASVLAKKTLIIVHKDFLLAQWRERISLFLPQARVGLIKAKVVDVCDKDIIIASLQSLSMKEYGEHVFKGIGLVIIDEVHRTGTEVFSQALRKVQFKYTLGLSATVTRKDGLTKVFQWYLGDVIYKKKRAEDNVCVKMVYYASNDVRYNKVEEIGYSGKPNFSRMINNICGHMDRTQRIVKEIVIAIEKSNQNKAGKRRKVLVLSDRKGHLATIRDLLPKNISSGFYVGNMKTEDLAESEKKDVILATFAFASEGFDAKDLDTLVLATPKSDIEQSVGRILRQKQEERVNTPLVIDFVDDFSIFPYQAMKRKRFYKSLGFSVTGGGGKGEEPSIFNGTCLFVD